MERKRPAPCCEDCEMLHLTSRGRELLRVKATVAKAAVLVLRNAGSGVPRLWVGG